MRNCLTYNYQLKVLFQNRPGFVSYYLNLEYNYVCYSVTKSGHFELCGPFIFDPILVLEHLKSYLHIQKYYKTLTIKISIMGHTSADDLHEA